MSSSKSTTYTPWHAFIRWFDTYTVQGKTELAFEKRIDWVRTVPFIGMHFAALFIFVVGWSPVAVTMAVLMYAIRMFAITGFYHRYFSHKAFKTSRSVQFIFAVIGASSVQRGPLWWAAHHRLHHVNSDKQNDEHSPRQQGFWWSHMGWFLSKHNFATRLDRIKDFARYPELKFIDRFDILVPTVFAISLFGFGELLAYGLPHWGTDGWQMLVWGFIVSTVFLYHITFTINSLAHTTGKRKFDTGDDSRNNWLLALFTFGEGWHNNHHHYPGSAKQGFAWWQLDISYLILKLLQLMGIIWDLRPVPERVLAAYRKQPLIHGDKSQ